MTSVVQLIVAPVAVIEPAPTPLITGTASDGGGTLIGRMTSTGAMSQTSPVGAVSARLTLASTAPVLAVSRWVQSVTPGAAASHWCTSVWSVAKVRAIAWVQSSPTANATDCG